MIIEKVLFHLLSNRLLDARTEERVCDRRVFAFDLTESDASSKYLLF